MERLGTFYAWSTTGTRLEIRKIVVLVLATQMRSVEKPLVS